MLSDSSPIYQQIADKIKDDIITGVVEEGEQVMSTNQYASFYRINPATAAKGFHRLIEERILYKQRGIGMFVSAGARERLRAQRREQFFEKRVVELLAEARKIGIPVEDIIQRINQVKGRESR